MASVEFPGELNHSKTNNFLRSLLSGEFKSGSRDWETANSDYIVGYQKLKQGKLMAVSFVSRSSAFASATQLKYQSIAIGAFILFVAIGLTLIFVRRLTEGLRLVWEATRKVSNGDFSVRVRMQETGDEISGLAKSFNQMASKIDALMKETAEKAVMAKEVETAKVVQQSFFPAAPYQGNRISVAGKSISASACGGDWYYHVSINGYMLIICADVMGHGVPAALLTATMHGAVSGFLKEFDDGETSAPNIQNLADQLNWAIFQSTQGSATATCSLSLINLKTGVMKVVNASHRAPFVFRKESTLKKNSGFKPIMGGKTTALGFKKALAPYEPVSYQLKPGDHVFLFTDGIIESPNLHGKMMRQTDMLRRVDGMLDGSGSAVDVVDAFNDDFKEFHHGGLDKLEDDCTFIIAQIPKTVSFEQETVEDTGEDDGDGLAPVLEAV